MNRRIIPIIIKYLYQSLILIFSFHSGPIGWGCGIHQLHLCRRVRLPQVQLLDEVVFTLHNTFERNMNSNILSLVMGK